MSKKLWFASGLAVRRVAKVDVDIGGKRIKAGEGIVASNQSANRDEDVFPNPGSFDVDRKRWDEEALGFGYGPHRRIGEWLARVELEIVFCRYPVSGSSLKGLVINGTYEATLFRKPPNLRLAISLEEIKHSPRGRDVGIVELPVTRGIEVWSSGDAS